MQEYEFWWDDDNIDHNLAYGQTDGGRYLVIVFAPKERGRLRVVTARDMTPTEKRRYRQR